MIETHTENFKREHEKLFFFGKGVCAGAIQEQVYTTVTNILLILYPYKIPGE